MNDPLPKDEDPETGERDAAGRRYEPPALRKYGSLAELTRSGTGTSMEGGKGPPQRRDP